jgi:hypothetical protein
MRIASLPPVLLLALACACSPAADGSGGSPAPSSPEPAPAPAPSPDQGGGDARPAAVPADHPQYARVEGTSFQNGCSADSGCFVGGCSSEICSAEQGVSSTCEAPAAGWPNTGATCGCVAGQCIWYGAGGGGAEGGGNGGSAGGQESSSGGQALPLQGNPCNADDKCAAGLSCITYYGIAGPRGPAMKSCEVKCAADGSCPAGQQCTTVADGPGQVCRPGR